MLCFGNRPFWRASGSMIVRILFTIRSLAYLADRLCRAGRRAARAVPGLGMAAVALTNTGMGFTVAVLRPLAPVVPQHIAGEKCRLICCTNGAETADFSIVNFSSLAFSQIQKKKSFNPHTILYRPVSQMQSSLDKDYNIVCKPS